MRIAYAVIIPCAIAIAVIVSGRGTPAVVAGWTIVVAAVWVGIIEFFGLVSTSRELTEKNRELGDALKVRTEFLSIISHELRTPLVPIIGYSDLILGGSFGDIPDAARGPVGIIRKRGQDLNQILDDLLLVTLTEQCAITVNLQPINTGEFLKDIVRTYLDLKRVGPDQILLEGEDIAVNADQTRLRQVIQNLVNNALKYSSEGKRIVISTKAEGANGVISVSDNGYGIGPEHLPYIFDLFYKAENGKCESQESVGLGLAIVEKLVKIMRGSISVESQLGKGSKFTINLPMAVKL